MARLYTINRFIGPDFSLLVPNWTFGAAVDDFCAASYSYRGPLYLLLTPDDATVLINISPERVRDALALICRLPHDQRINPAPTGPLREARTGEAMSARSRLSEEPDVTAEALAEAESIWVAGDTGICLHGEPHRISLFRFRDGHCVDVVHATDRHRIEPIGEE